MALAFSTPHGPPTPAVVITRSDTSIVLQWETEDGPRPPFTLRYSPSAAQVSLCGGMTARDHHLLQIRNWGPRIQDAAYSLYTSARRGVLHGLDLSQFQRVMEDLGLPRYVDTVRLFIAFDRDGKKCLSFNDFLHGLAAMSPDTKSHGLWGRVRAEFIFRYYASSCTGTLFRRDMDKLLMDLASLRPSEAVGGDTEAATVKEKKSTPEEGPEGEAAEEGQEEEAAEEGQEGEAAEEGQEEGDAEELVDLMPKTGVLSCNAFCTLIAQRYEEYEGVDELLRLKFTPFYA